MTAALDALRARDWDAFARRLHPDVVHRTPGVPEPILGREAFVLLSRQAVARTPDVRFEVERLVTEGDTVVVIGDKRRIPIVIHHAQAQATAQFSELVQALAAV